MYFLAHCCILLPHKVQHDASILLLLKRGFAFCYPSSLFPQFPISTKKTVYNIHILTFRYLKWWITWNGPTELFFSYFWLHYFYWSGKYYFFVHTLEHKINMRWQKVAVWYHSYNPLALKWWGQRVREHLTIFTIEFVEKQLLKVLQWHKRAAFLPCSSRIYGSFLFREKFATTKC